MRGPREPTAFLFKAKGCAAGAKGSTGECLQGAAVGGMRRVSEAR